MLVDRVEVYTAGKDLVENAQFLAGRDSYGHGASKK